MSKLQWRALIYQFICFGALFFGARFLVMQYSHLSGFWIPITAFVIATILSPMLLPYILVLLESE